MAEEIENKKENNDKKEENFQVKTGIRKTTKNKSEMSGDSSLRIKLNDGKYMIAVSDGMGSRTKSKKK